jgi:hypothetical protein
MKHTTATDVSSHDSGPFETVYTTASYSPVAGDWDVLTLDEPFEWNGVDNILVDTAFSLLPDWNSSGQQRVFDAPNGFRYSRSDSGDQTNANTTVTTNYKPNIRFTIVAPEPEEPLTPGNVLITIEDSLIIISWDEVVNADYYIVEATDDITNDFNDISSEGNFATEEGRIVWSRNIQADEDYLFFRIKAARGSYNTPAALR